MAQHSPLIIGMLAEIRTGEARRRAEDACSVWERNRRASRRRWFGRRRHHGLALPAAAPTAARTAPGMPRRENVTPRRPDPARAPAGASAR